jgi:transposase
LEKELEDARIKISAVVSDLLGVSGRRILHALVDGQRDPRKLAELARGRMRARIPELVEALDGDFREHHAFLVRMHLRRIDEISAAIDELSERIEEAMGPFLRQRELLETIPGVGQHTAEVIVAEIGADMGRFPSAGNLASWAGTTPGHYMSAGVSTSHRTRPGSRWLAAALGIAAICAGRSENTYIGAWYRRLLPRLGNDRAIVALQHDILVAAWHMLSRDEPYRDLAAAHYERLDPERIRRNAAAQLQRLGYRLTLVPAA